MPRDNDFATNTKIKLAERAGYKCCYLGCGQATIGPSREKNDTDSSNTGVAAHIYSASFGKGAKRIPLPEMKPEAIKSQENGIWMCGTHGHYIDTDEITFTVEQIKKWKKIGEEVARIMQEFRCNYLDAIKKIEHSNPTITEMILFAQKHDPSTDRYYTWDLALYRKILQLIPENARVRSRNGGFIHLHPASLRNSINDYLSDTYNFPVDYSFFDKNIQTYKEEMDIALDELSNFLSLNTFPEFDSYRMSREWKETKEGLTHYIKAQNRINKLSFNFIQKFDNFHRYCRDKFLE
ncbi:MAG: hypothetical protein AAB553_01270 [Patescibacteria group bacterium]